MRYEFGELLDVDLISGLFDFFHQTTGLRCDIFALTGVPLTSWTKWEPLCANFHRKNDDTRRLCEESDTTLVNQLLTDRKYAIYTCKNGLTDAAARVMVGGEHVANVLCGQLFCHEPDLGFFRNQAQLYDFDESEYLHAVRQVPIVPEGRLQTVLGYVSHLAGLLGDLGLRHLKQLEAEDALRASESKYRSIFENAVEGIFRCGPDGRYTQVNPALARMHGYESPEKMLRSVPSMEDHLFLEPGEKELFFSLLRNQDLVSTFESQARTVDQSKIWVSLNARAVDDGDGMSAYEGTMESITERKQAEIGMLMAQQRLEALSRTLLKKMEIERHYVAHELHDEIGQALTAVKMSLESLEIRGTIPKGNDALGDCVSVINRAISQVRDLSVNLRPAVLDDLGLIAALRWLVNSMISRSDIEVDFSADEDLDLELSKGMATACFRVAQEAVTNIFRHAKASSVAISLVRDGEESKLTVRDNGVGFDVTLAQSRAARGESFGLLGMRERVALSGGSLLLESTPGAGCRVTAYFPLRKE
jgi:PAS domain S-box-containing protein